MKQQQHGFGMCMYGLQYAIGHVGRGTPLATANPLTAEQFLDLAVTHNLASIEIPLALASPSLDRAEITGFGKRARDAGLRVVVSGPSLFDGGEMAEHINLCPAIGAERLRCVGSRINCGDRRPLGGYDGWQRHVDKIIEKLRAVAPIAEAAGVQVGLENHQDVDSKDLLRLCAEVGSDAVGVTLDTGNALAVAEDPVEFAQKILPHLVDVHLKDYRLINSEEGYRLVHCAIGDGVLDFASLFRLFATRPGLTVGLEMAAWHERHIRVLADDYWDGLGERDMRTFLPVLRLWRERGEDADDWQTPFELGDTSNAWEWEMERFERSVENMARLEESL